MQETEDRLLIRYLLGDLNEGERDRVEERYQVDDEFYLRLRVAEEELMDSYAAGELSGGERQRFEQAYLTQPSRRRRVEANSELLDLIARETSAPASRLRGLMGSLLRALPGRNARLQYSLAGLLLLGVFSGLLGWLLIDRARTRGELEQARAQWRQKEDEYQRQLAALKQPPPAATPADTPPGVPTPVPRDERPPGERVEQAQRRRGRNDSNEVDGRGRVASPVVAFALPRGALRTPDPDARPQGSLVIPRGAVLVRLTVDLERNRYQGYRVSIQKVGGREVWYQPARKGRQGSSSERATFDVPASELGSGDYIVKVTGNDSSGEEEILAFQQINVLNLNPRLKQTESEP